MKTNSTHINRMLSRKIAQTRDASAITVEYKTHELSLGDNHKCIYKHLYTKSLSFSPHPPLSLSPSSLSLLPSLSHAHTLSTAQLSTHIRCTAVRLTILLPSPLLSSEHLPPLWDIKHTKLQELVVYTLTT